MLSIIDAAGSRMGVIIEREWPHVIRHLIKFIKIDVKLLLHFLKKERIEPSFLLENEAVTGGILIKSSL